MTVNPSDTETIRLNRYLAMLGVGARRACDDIIVAGRVKVDNRTVRVVGTRVVPGQNRVSVDGVPVENPQRPVVVLLNKPLGVVSTVSDPLQRPTVVDLCRRYARKRRLYPVGRLDINTTGAILLTNDGMLCYRLTHPRYQISRIYVVRVRGLVNERKLNRLDKLAMPRRSSGAQWTGVRFAKEIGRESLLRITLREGRNRQVRKMCESVGLKVIQLKRVQFGPITIRKLPLGACRPLEKGELDKLKQLTA
ncbi:MAG: rRNA pseudouridine synthase [Candidatus Latescibacterota bacterium]|nr:MAG: rRNA pseudouridine synthase [Candidatus Latescibacterota bacterium]